MKSNIQTPEIGLFPSKYYMSSFLIVVVIVVVVCILFIPISSTSIARTKPRNGQMSEKAHVRNFSQVLPHAAAKSTGSSTIITNPGYWTHSQIATAYGLNGIACVQNAGKGSTVAIIGAYSIPSIKADLSAFLSSQYGPFNGNKTLAATIANALTIVSLNSSGGIITTPQVDTNWGMEMSMDVQAVVSMAPGAKVYLIQAYDATTPSLVAALNYAINLNPNIVTMSWGGSYPCLRSDGVMGVFNSCPADSVFSNSNIIFLASAGDSGAATGWPMAHPSVISVGGSTLSSINTSTGTCTSVGWNGSGGGPDVYYPPPAAQQAGFTQQVLRQTPDISLVADPASGVVVYDSSYSKTLTVVGGTSLSAPLLAGILAVVNSSRINTGKSALTRDQVWSVIYPSGVYKGPGSVNPYMQDIASGSNGYAATTGYDFNTGMGGPNRAFYNKLVSL